MLWYYAALILFAVINLGVFWKSVAQSKAGHFYSDTPFLFPLSIFVWGDGLVLAPFWILVAGVMAFFPPTRFAQFYLLTISIRSAYEVVYWLTQQAGHMENNPPLFRKVAWIKPNDAAILYQLMNMCLAILCLSGVWWLGQL